ncbi:MAG TPA: glutamate-1-semialdehyde 2,1-aminomutase [Terriglobales bacterium]|nr:glutamate-1-semialdehyde 2,1-aminomutase [Terriglobales bacterium]
MDTSRSQQLQQQAEARIPGGVNSPVRSFRSVGGGPRWMAHGAGAVIVDVDGNRYLDFIQSWGALLLGHAPAPVVQAIQTAAAAGTSFGASTPAELELAEAVNRAMPMAEMVRAVNSGTEATMAAVRLARGFTGRNKIIKANGAYHGHADVFLVQAGSGVATQGLASSAGVPAAAVADTLSLPYNDLAAVERALAANPGEVAAVIVEPVAGNMGCVPPQPGYLQGLRQLTSRHGALLIFDEVMTGFRVAHGGAVARYGVTPDLVTLGKIIGGGLPVAAYGGRTDIMRRVAPLGPVYQAGTLSGNPVAMAAGVATLRQLEAQPELYATLERRGQQLEDGVRAAIRATGVPAVVQRVGAMLTVFFTPNPVHNFAEAETCDTAAFARFHRALLAGGVLWPPSQFEAAFFGAAHSEADIEHTLTAVQRAFTIAGE